MVKWSIQFNSNMAYEWEDPLKLILVKTGNLWDLGLALISLKLMCPLTLKFEKALIQLCLEIVYKFIFYESVHNFQLIFNPDTESKFEKSESCTYMYILYSTTVCSSMTKIFLNNNFCIYMCVIYNKINILATSSTTFCLPDFWVTTVG